MSESKTCPECGGELVKRNGKYGEFFGCSNFPDCRYIKKESTIEKSYGECPNCGSPLIKREGKKGAFLSCSSFPKCRFTMNYKKGMKIDFSDVERCPKCGSALIKREGKFGEFMSCSNFPKCKFTIILK